MKTFVLRLNTGLSCKLQGDDLEYPRCLFCPFCRQVWATFEAQASDALKASNAICQACGALDRSELPGWFQIQVAGSVLTDFAYGDFTAWWVLSQLSPALLKREFILHMMHYGVDLDGNNLNESLAARLTGTGKFIAFATATYGTQPPPRR